jgi:hypothetical protein
MRATLMGCTAPLCGVAVYCAELSSVVLCCAVLHRYEDVLHEGNLDEDTPHEEPLPVPDNETGPLADYDRQKRK